jgi:hypothetical protein
VNAQDNLDLQWRARKDLVDKLRDHHNDIQYEAKKAEAQMLDLSTQIEYLNHEKVSLKQSVEELRNQINSENTVRILSTINQEVTLEFKSIQDEQN